MGMVFNFKNKLMEGLASLLNALNEFLKTLQKRPNLINIIHVPLLIYQ